MAKFKKYFIIKRDTMVNFKIYTRAVILNKERNKVLLIKKNNKQKIASNNWLLPGGTLEFNEEVELSLIREIKEETNLNIIDLQLITSKKILVEKTHWLGLYFLVNVANEADLMNAEKDKHEFVKFVPLNDIPDLKDYAVLQFIKGIDSNKEFFTTPVNDKKHAMGEALSKYIENKVHGFLKTNVELFSRIKIIGNYDRSTHVSKHEKNDKLFNFKRPTAFIDGDILYISCFPGKDYIYHYAKLIRTYLHINEIEKEVSYLQPSQATIEYAFKKTNIENIPNADVIIYGNVDKIGLWEDKDFVGEGDFLWKSGKINGKRVLLLGCKFSIWGDAGFDFIKILAKSNNFSTFVYIGKLGTLSENVSPNTFIATGAESFVNEKTIHWRNIFSNIDDNSVIYGKHVTYPSVLDETKEEIKLLKNEYDFIDPEIGNMALACDELGKQFSYLHIISDNVVNHNKLENLSNERKSLILNKRTKLFKDIGKIIETNL